jgi:hypothetical protein
LVLTVEIPAGQTICVSGLPITGTGNYKPFRMLAQDNGKPYDAFVLNNNIYAGNTDALPIGWTVFFNGTYISA